MEKEVLDSWKQIADYLQRTVRTCQRWEKEMDLPIHRLDGSRKPAVFAYQDEIDIWFKKKLEEHEILAKSAPRFWINKSRWVLALYALTAVLLIGVFSWHFLLPRGPEIFPFGKPALGVLYFQNKTGDTSKDNWRSALSDLMISSLSTSPDVIVISGGRTFQVLKKLGLLDTSEYRTEDLKKVADRTEASHFILGNYAYDGDEWLLEAQLLDTDSLEVSHSAHTAGRQDHLFAMVRDLAEQILAPFDLPTWKQTAEGSNSAPQSLHPSVEAYKYYQLGRHLEKRYYAFLRTQDYEEAIKMFRMAITQEPRYADAYWGLGDLYQQRFVETNDEDIKTLMIHCYKKAHEISPELAPVNSGMGWVFFYLEDLDKSYQYFRRSVELAPEDASVQYNAGGFLRTIGLNRLAIEFYKKAIAHDFLNIDAHMLLATCYMYIGEYKKAVETLEDIIRFEPDDWQLRLNLARQFLLLKNRDEAKAQIEAAEKIFPDTPLHGYFRAWFWAAEGKNKEAAAAITGASPFNHAYLLSNVLALLDRKEEAIRLIQDGIERGYTETQDFLFVYPFLASNPCYDNLRDDKRFKALLEKQKAVHREMQQKFGGF